MKVLIEIARWCFCQLLFINIVITLSFCFFNTSFRALLCSTLLTNILVFKNIKVAKVSFGSQSSKHLPPPPEKSFSFKNSKKRKHDIKFPSPRMFMFIYPNTPYPLRTCLSWCYCIVFTPTDKIFFKMCSL